MDVPRQMILMFQIYFLSSINGFWLGIENWEIKSIHRLLFSLILSQHTLFNITTDRQATYNLTKGDIHSRHTYTPIHQICLGLSLRHSDRNNVVLGMLSAPNYGYSITPRQCLKWKTSIANAVIKNIQLNNDVYIPPGMAKDVIPMFHLDNIDWLEDTPDGKNTTHYLILSIFQRKQNCSGNYLPELVQHTTSLKLLENSFGVLLPHDKPVKGMSKHTEGASDFNVRNVNTKEETIQHWLLIYEVWKICYVIIRHLSHIINKKNINHTAILQNVIYMYMYLMWKWNKIVMWVYLS